ncbi:MAG: hypothetical protein OIN66_10410 [Candidatus Methanoperedens sp.]|nr:hypothetical protein [Candidatus Methanoperedens sp.]
MICYAQKNTNQKYESIITNSVRAQIVNILKDGKPKRFKEIKKLSDRQDTVINRELKILIEREFVKKSGKNYTTRYSLDLTNEAVQEYLKKLEIAIPTEAQIEFIPPPPSGLIPYSPNWVIEDRESPEGRTEIIGRPETKDEAMEEKATVAKKLIDKIRVYTISEKIEEYEDEELGHKKWSITNDEFIEIACIINRILNERSYAYVDHELKKDPDLKHVEGKDYVEKLLKAFNKPLKLVITYNPA